MKGNIVVELRKLVKTLYAEGHEEIFAFSIVEEGNGVSVQVSDFSLEPEVLEKRYGSTYAQAVKSLKLAKARFGQNCTAINSLICDEVDEEVFLDGNILRVMNLNVDM